MRVVLDTNILISGLISPTGTPGRLMDAWLEDRFTLISSEEQLLEFRRASRIEGRLFGFAKKNATEQ